MAVVVGEAAVRIRADADAGTIEDDAGGPILGALDKIGGKGAALLGGAIGGVALGAAFGTAMENSRIEDKFAARLGLTEGRSAEIGAAAGDLYAGAYGESMEEVYGSVEAVMSSIDGMATASSADLEAMTARAMDFASAFDQDVTTATASAGLLIKNGLAKDGTQAFDLLTRSFQQIPAAMREEVPAILDEYGTNFRALGFTGEQAFALITDAAQQGPFVLDKMGDALKEFTIRGSDMSEASVGAYDAIGLSADKMSRRIAEGGEGAQGALQEVAEGILGIKDPAERANTAIALFGTPLEDLSVDQIPDFLDSIANVGPGMTDAAGAVDALGETLNDNASTNLTSFTRQVQTLAVDFLGGKLLPAAERVGGFLATNFGPAVETVAGVLSGTVIPAVRSLAEWIAENETPLLVIGGIIATLFVPHLIALAVQSTITRATVVGAWIAKQAAVVGAAIVHSAQIGMMIVRFVALGAAAVAQGIVTVAAWVGMGVAAVAQAAIVAAAWLGAQIRTVASLAVMAAGFVVQGAVMLAATTVTVAGVVAGWVLMGAQALAAAARVAAAWLIAMGPIGLVIAAVAGVVYLIVSNWETIKTKTVEAWNAVVGFVVGAWNGLTNAISTGVSSAVSFVTGLPGRILGAIGDFGALLYNKGRDLITGLINGIASAASFVGNVAKNVVNSIIRFVNSNIIDGINDLLEFRIAGITINPPDIPRIPTLHTGGVFQSGSSTGEGLALLRDRERVATPEQEGVANSLLARLLDGDLPAGRGGGVTVQQTIVQQPGESGAALAARVTQGVVWNLNGGITRPVGATS